MGTFEGVIFEGAILEGAISEALYLRKTNVMGHGRLWELQ
jgi:hypothetical protein